MTSDINLYEVFRRDIGLQFFKCFLHFPPFGKQVITPCSCVLVSFPFLKLSFIQSMKKSPN